MKTDLNVDQIKKLWMLDLIIQSGSLKQAALRAKVSPSAVSQALGSLEKSVGKPLLVRERGGIAPTQEALGILSIVRPAFAAFDRLRDFGREPVPQMSWLNFGTYESIAVDLLPGLLHRLRDRMPHLRLGLRISRTGALLTMIRKGELCSAVVTETDELGRFYCKDVAEDRLGVFISSAHPIGRAGWSAVKCHGVGSLSAGKDGYPRYFARFLKQLDVGKPLILSDSFEALRCAAEAGVLAAVLPHRVAKRSPGLIEVRPGTAPWKESGRHRIALVSLASCDAAETDFLAEEARRILQHA